MTNYKATLRLKTDTSETGIIGYLPFGADKSTFQKYQQVYPEMLITCEEPKMGMTTDIPIKNLEFICVNNGLSIGKRDE